MATATSSARARRWRLTRLSDGPRWKLIVDAVGRSGDDNMAADVELLDAAVRTRARSLRLYRWNPPTLSIGRNQSIEELQREPGAPPPPPGGGGGGLAVVRRPTGGGAVWHEHELTYALAAPIEVFGSLRKAYCEIHTRIGAALRALGVNSVLAPARRSAGPSGRPASCFAVPVGGELLVNGRKIVGSAQVRKRDAFLQHGSILLEGSQAAVSPLSAETTLAAVLGRRVPFQEVASAIIAAWGEPLEQTARPPVSPSDIAPLAAR